MQIKAAVLNGKNSVVIREYELPEIKDNEILVKVISNSICLSTYKAAILGEDHKRVPNDIKEHPAITGHEFCGIIEQVGSKYKDQYQVGEKFALQPAMGLDSGYSAGYSYEYFGGNTTYCIIPEIAIEKGCLLPYKGSYFANASLAEPMSCIIGAYHATYHTTPYVYEHKMGIQPNGNLALLGCCGPMGIGAIDYAIHGPIKPKLVVVTDIDENRLERAKQLITPQEAQNQGITLIYLNGKDPDLLETMINYTEGKKFDDVFVFAAISPLIEQADELLGNDGCLNFFAGPTNKAFKAPFNFYNVHYESTHIVGTSGGSTSDMLESLEKSGAGILNPSYMITHIGGLDAAPNTILNLPNIPGGKKLIYTQITMPLTAIEDFRALGKDNQLFEKLADICDAHHGIWNEEAEKYLLEYYNVL